MSLCGICDSPQLTSIDAALKAGTSVRKAAQDFGYSKSAMGRHRALCLPRQALTLTALQRYDEGHQEAQEHAVSVVQGVQERIGTIDTVARALHRLILAEIEAGRPPSLSLIRTWLQAQETTLRAQAGIEARGDVFRDERPHADVRQIVGTVLRALEVYPDARAAVAKALQGGLRIERQDEEQAN